MTRLSMGEAINLALSEAFESDQPIVHLGQDIGPYGGTFGVTRGLWEKYGDEVIRDGPLCESATVGFGVGLAIAGTRAVVELEFFDFIGLAMDQVVNQAAKLHYFTGGKLTVPLIVRVPIVARMGMGPQHSQSLESWFMHIPGLRVAMPSNAQDALGLMRTALGDPNPVMFIENVRLYGRKMDVDTDALPIPYGQARIAREGTDVTVIALSGMVDEALKAAQELEAGGISVEVIDPRTIAPLDIDTIVASIEKTGRAVVTHDAHKTAGAGAEIAALCTERAFSSLSTPVARVTGLDVPIPCGPILSEVYPSAESVSAAVTELVGGAVAT